MKDELGIYIHIPFCASKCFYCDFCSFDNKENLIEKYIDALCAEILKNSEILSSYKIRTIYIGGGTPSFINEKYIKKIMNVLNFFIYDKPKEVTIECNPNSITENKIKEYLSCGINRFSIGLQSTEDNILKVIGRGHNYQNYINSLNLLKKYNVENISTDLIYPLPYLTIDILKKEIDTLINLSKDYNLNHISIYNLELHENSKLHFLISEKYLNLCSEEEEYEMKKYIENTLNKNGFKRYEISNFAKEGFESIHNTIYWKQNHYLGFGLNASSFFNGIRYSNTDCLDEYIEYYLNNNIKYNVKNYEKEMNKLDLMKEYVILNLRLINGINIKEFYAKFKTNILDVFKLEFSSLENKGLIIIEKDRIYLSDRGLEVANIVFEEFI